MDDELQLRILTPGREALAVPVDSVNLTASEGEVGILPGHAALLTALRPGPATVVTGGQTHHWALGGGFLEVADGRVTALVQSAESADQIDVERAEARRRAREEELKREQLSEFEMKVAEVSLEKQLTRIQVAGRLVGR